MSDEKRSSRNVKNVDYKVLDSIGKGSPSPLKNDEKSVVYSFPPKSPVLASGVSHSAGVSLSTRSFISDSLHGTPAGGDPASCPDEKQELKKKLAEVEKRTAILREKREVEALKRELEAKEEECRVLEKEVSGQPKGVADSGRASGACGSSHASVDKKGMNLDINDLRSMKKLRKQAKKQLNLHGLVVESSSDSDSDSSSSEFSETDSDLNSGTSGKSKHKKKHRKSNSKKSGLTSKASEAIKNRQRYPHAYLRFDYASKNMSFDKLDLNLFVAGELEIISSSKTENLERKGRLNLLKKLMYLSSSYEVLVIKSLYAAVLREVELGHLNWGEDFSYVESAVLQKTKMKSKNTSESFQFRPKPAYNLPKEFSSNSSTPEEKIWYCAKYQSNKCSQRSSHVVTVKGKFRMAKHVCATCYLKDKKELSHPECSSACPHQI